MIEFVRNGYVRREETIRFDESEPFIFTDRMIQSMIAYGYKGLESDLIYDEQTQSMRVSAPHQLQITNNESTNHTAVNDIDIDSFNEIIIDCVRNQQPIGLLANYLNDDDDNDQDLPSTFG